MNRKYLKITNKDGKVWLMPKQHMKTGLELYQPSSKKGMLLKRWLPWLYWLKPLMGKLGMSDIEYVMDPQIHHIIEKEFNQDAVEYSVFEGTPCVHQKTTIQIFKGENILGYCKVTKIQNFMVYFSMNRSCLVGCMKRVLTRYQNVLIAVRPKMEILSFCKQQPRPLIRLLSMNLG